MRISNKTLVKLHLNKKRARQVKKAIDAAFGNGDIRCDIIDCLAHLRHLCDLEALDYADLDRTAYDHYCTEK
jgi:hypothetical protein